MQIQVVARWPHRYGSVEATFAEPEFKFHDQTSGADIRLVINREEKRFFAEYEAAISDDLTKALVAQANGTGAKLVPAFRREVDKITMPGENALQRLLALLKYHLNNDSLSEQVTIEHTTFVFTESVHVDVPPKLGFFGRAVTSEPLNSSSASLIKSHFDNGFQPFLALRHLHRAHEDITPRYKWIDASIAAELAIKEFLIRKEPKLETLILEVQSPPMGKLYGPVLKSVIQEESPKRKEMQKGSEIRNKLIHRPTEGHVGFQKAVDYCVDVEIAMYHLLTHLCPDDFVVQRICNARFAGMVVNN